MKFLQVCGNRKGPVPRFVITGSGFGMQFNFGSSVLGLGSGSGSTTLPETKINVPDPYKSKFI